MRDEKIWNNDIKLLVTFKIGTYLRVTRPIYSVNLNTVQTFNRHATPHSKVSFAMLFVKCGPSLSILDTDELPKGGSVSHKIDFLTLKMTYFAPNHIFLPWTAPADPYGFNIGWTWLNIVKHIQGSLLGPFRPQKSVIEGPWKCPKWAFLAHKCHFLTIESFSRPKWVEHWVNMVDGWTLLDTSRGVSLNPLGPQEMSPGGPRGAQKWPFSTQKWHIWP